MNKYMKVRLSFLCILCCFSVCLKGQTAKDSMAVVSASWSVKEIQKGVVLKQTFVPLLYGVPQTISIIEMTPRFRKVGIAIFDEMRVTSQIASQSNVIAAINGSFFDMKRGNSVCFLKVGDQVVDTTTIYELKRRITGAIYERKGKIKIIPWNRQIEKKYKSNVGTMLASGPLLLKDSKLCDWSSCEKAFVETKHPRSAISITKGGKILLITVDGRSPKHAEGVSIPELAHLIRILGGRDAINLDGGGSTTLWVSGEPENGVVNYPSENSRFEHTGERKVPNIIYVH